MTPMSFDDFLRRWIGAVFELGRDAPRSMVKAHDICKRVYAEAGGKDDRDVCIEILKAWHSAPKEGWDSPTCHLAESIWGKPAVEQVAGTWVVPLTALIKVTEVLRTLPLTIRMIAGARILGWDYWPIAVTIRESMSAIVQEVEDAEDASALIKAAAPFRNELPSYLVLAKEPNELIELVGMRENVDLELLTLQDLRLIVGEDGAAFARWSVLHPDFSALLRNRFENAARRMRAEYETKPLSYLLESTTATLSK
jgi:hypothetical protein